jgi:apolipoprotein N-acyltransferase
MNAKKFSFQGKPALLCGATALMVLAVSFPSLSPLLFAVFSVVFALIEGEDILKQLLLLFFLVSTVVLIIFANPFFIQTQPLLFLIAMLYFIAMLGLDLLIAFYALNHEYALFLIFGYVAAIRLTLNLSTVVFPFYWTLAMQLLPFMEVISQCALPLLWEAFCVSCAAALYSPVVLGLDPRLRKSPRHRLIQVAVIAMLVVVFSGIARVGLGHSSFKPGLECALVQGGYSRSDYVLIERHPEFGIRMAQKYLEHLAEVANQRFVVMPESALPLHLIEDSEILQKIKDIARLRNQYIMTGILLKEGGSVYNASALIDPQGRLQNVYRKRNPALFVETTTFTPGTTATTFTVDGHAIAPVICYESLFLRNYFRDKKPKLYIVISNDIFSDKAILSYLHIAYGVINARTLGTPLLQVMQNGPSVYLNSRGQLRFLTKPYEQAVGLRVDIQ